MQPYGMPRPIKTRTMRYLEFVSRRLRSIGSAYRIRTVFMQHDSSLGSIAGYARALTASLVRESTVVTRRQASREARRSDSLESITVAGGVSRAKSPWHSVFDRRTGKSERTMDRYRTTKGPTFRIYCPHARQNLPHPSCLAFSQ